MQLNTGRKMFKNGFRKDHRKEAYDQGYDDEWVYINGGGEGVEGGGAKLSNKQPKFLNLLVLVHLKNTL